MTALSRRLIAGFAALGLVASAAATWVHYQLLANPGYTSFCDAKVLVVKFNDYQCPPCKETYLASR